MIRAKVVKMSEDDLDREALSEAGEILRKGGLVAFPTETVYGLGGNGLDPSASEKIYEAKGRPSDNPLIIHIARMEDLPPIVKEIPEKARRLAEACWPGPLTMIFYKSDIVPLETTGGLNTVAVRFPSNKIAQEMILAGGGYVAAPSANTSGRPSPTEAKHVEEDLGDKIDMIIDGGSVDIGLESTIVDCTVDPPVILRPGYVNQDMLQQVISRVGIDPGLSSEDKNIRPKAPGMKYRHYAPKAKLILVDGADEKVAAYICGQVQKKQAAGEQVGVICSGETRAMYKEGQIRCIGRRQNEEEIAQHLYAVLRDFDEEDISLIYSETFNTPRIGSAIMNRLIKAAGHEIVEV